MPLSHKLKELRAKPQHERERILVISLAICVPILLAGGVLAFIYEREHTSTVDVVDFKKLGAYFSGSVQDIRSTVSGIKAAPQTGGDPVATQ